MIDLILHLVLLAVAIVVIAEAIPGIRLDGFGTALVVAVVYSVINVILGSVLKFLALPLILVTLGLFLLVVNAGMLWLTDQLIEDFEISDLRTTFVAALLITLADAVLGLVF